MKNRAPLALIEQVIMLLVLAVAAAVCLQIFLWADRQADTNSLTDTALQQVQNTAQVLKSTAEPALAAELLGGQIENEIWIQSLPGYEIHTVCLDSGNPLLGCATVTAVQEGKQLVQLTVYWQEVVP